MRQLAILLALFLTAGLAAAGEYNHPFAAGQTQSLALEAPSLLEWGPSTLGFSQSWSGGQSRSQGYMLKEFRSQLHPSLTFHARFGLSFEPGAMSGSEPAAPRFEIPEATLTWRAGDNATLQLHFQQGSLWDNPLRRYGVAGYDPWYARPSALDGTP